MIKVNCETKDKLRLADMEPFQGNLKKRTEQDIDELRKSLVNEGLMMPFAIWKQGEKNYLLDGHGRREALLSIVSAEAEFPVVYIEALTEDDARKALLQITSQYGKITKAGVKQFTASIPTYVAPSISKYVLPKTAVTKVRAPVTSCSKRVIKIQVDIADYDAVMEILAKAPYIKIL